MGLSGTPGWPDCVYKNHKANPKTDTVECYGLATITMHDARGCHRVCMKHAEWRMGKSIIYGHGSTCSEKSK